MCAEAPIVTAPRDPRRRGVALIIVLGLMSVLVIMAVSFVVVMRTERLTARGFVNDFRVRELNYVALTHAMDHIQKDAEAGSWMYPPWPVGALHSGQNSLSSGGTGAGRDVLVWNGRNYAASNVHVAAEITTNDMKWIEIQEGTQYVGHVCYMIMNTSGEIDANGNGSMDPQLAKSIPRYLGTNANELQLHNSLLPSLTSYGTNIYNARCGSPGTTRNKAFGRAESMPDLWIAGRYGYSAAYPIQYPRPSGFTTFSHYPTGFAVNGIAQAPIYIGGDQAQVIAQRGQIQNQFVSAGFTLPQAQTLTLNLLDYIDNDFIPGNAGGTVAPSINTVATEPVPMLNEIVVGSVLQDSGANRTLTINLDVEVWYPFFGITNLLTYSVRTTPKLTGGNFSTLTVGTPALTPKAGPWFWNNVATPGMFYRYTGRWTATAPVTNAVLPTALQFPTFDLVDNAGAVADGIAPGAGGVSMTLPWANFMAGAVGAVSYSGWKANDPRINWQFPNLATSDHSLMWSNELKKAASLTGSTLGSVNFTTQPYGEDSRWQMHVRNRDYLPSVGHIGLLLYDSSLPWKSVPLLGPTAKPVLDYFTVQSASRRGIVNMNTTNEAVLATAFYRAPCEIVPGATNGAAVDAATARAIARAIMQGRPVGGYTNVGDVARAGTALQTQLPTGAPGARWHDPDRESLIRNTEGLLGTRQNLFTIVLIAECRKKVINPETGALPPFRLAGQRAVAEVWRDPIRSPDPGGGPARNRMFVHFFRWLDD